MGLKLSLGMKNSCKLATGKVTVENTTELKTSTTVHFDRCVIFRGNHHLWRNDPCDWLTQAGASRDNRHVFRMHFICPARIILGVFTKSLHIKALTFQAF